MSYKYRDVVDKLTVFPYTDADDKEHWFKLTDRAVLSVLANRADDDGVCYPGYGLIAKEAMCDRRSVIRSIVVLKGLNFLSSAPGTERLSNTYTLDLDAIKQVAEEHCGSKAEKKPKREGNFGKKQDLRKYKRKLKPLPQAQAIDYDDDDDDEVA
jgi:hypothetical protein